VLFLDIDGVLVPFDAEGGICEEQLLQLKRIHDSTGCKIVLSSSWRAFKSRVKQVNDHLVRVGIPALIGQTPQLGIDRPKEIVTWLETHESDRVDRLARLTDGAIVENPEVSREVEAVLGEKISHWVAIDDMELSSYDTKWGFAMRGHFVQTEIETGLLEEHANLAVRILNDGVTEEDRQRERELLQGLHQQFTPGDE